MHSFYNSLKSITPLQFVKWALVGFGFWIALLIMTPYPHYLPPDFSYGFLGNKSTYFYRSGYFIGFYAHIASAPIAIFSGGIQMSRTLRQWYPTVHRYVGKVYVAAVLFAAAPGGFIMAMKSFGGWSTTICFGMIAVGAWIATLAGWRSAKRYDLTRHRDWMLRSYVLMLSAVFLRLGHFFLRSFNMDLELTYQVAAWASWIVPMTFLELTIAAIHFRVNRTAKSLT
ncbi:MAG: DUF2306 domain-containing protein [Planctomycetales bacterium]|nr:DUF2306 domain-containing protein [Planctomycetales bacterium]